MEQDIFVRGNRLVFKKRAYDLKEITVSGASVYKGGPKTIFGINIGQLAHWCWLAGIYISVSAILCGLGLAFFMLIGLLKTGLIFGILNLILNISFFLFSIAFTASILWVFCSSDIHRIDLMNIYGDKIELNCDNKNEVQRLYQEINYAIFENLASNNTFTRSSWL
jgi:hypothetical protein